MTNALTSVIQELITQRDEAWKKLEQLTSQREEEDRAITVMVRRLNRAEAEQDRLTAELDAVGYQYAHDIEAMKERAEKTEAEVARLREALRELLTVSRRAVRLSQEHPEFRLYAMEPMEIAIANAALATEDTP